jgi:hypothetical protein
MSRRMDWQKARFVGRPTLDWREREDAAARWLRRVIRQLSNVCVLNVFNRSIRWSRIIGNGGTTAKKLPRNSSNGWNEKRLRI